MPRYEIVFHNGYGREIDSMKVTAPSMAAALSLSADLLDSGAIRGGELAASAAIEEVGVYDQERPVACVVDESAGMAERFAARTEPGAYQEGLHSVRSELHPSTTKETN